MREILFRGKRLDNGEWVEGYYCMAFRWGGDKDPKTAIQERDCYYFRLVDPATVGQYTGLKDKNGKRIFEGDVVKACNSQAEIYKSSRPSVVECDIHNCNCCYGVYGWSFVGGNADIKDLYVIVVGNIYDNPEYRRNES